MSRGTNLRWLACSCLLVLGGIAVIVLSGCDESSVNAGDSFAITPSEITLYAATSGQALQVTGTGVPPYNWTVSDTNIGTISGFGSSVTYVRVADEGVNVVTVYDGHSWSASATITHVSGGGALDVYVVAGDSTLSTNGEQVVLGAIGGVSPYAWTMVNSNAGSFYATNVGDTVIYIRNGAGNNTVIATDSTSSSDSILITQP
jgi:hypothetical protein